MLIRKFIAYSFILRHTTYQFWRIQIPLDPCERDRFPDPAVISLAQGEVIFFPIFPYQQSCRPIRSNIRSTTARFK